MIGALDQLNVFVWRNAELGGKVQVRPDGMITTPLIPDLPGRRQDARPSSPRTSAWR